MQGYLKVEEVQQVLGGGRSIYRDTDYQRAILAASAQIDRWTGRRFVQDADASIRQFIATPDDPNCPVWPFLGANRVCVGDYVDPDTVTVETDDAGDGTWVQWDPSEWQPAADDRGNGPFVRLDGEPWRWIATTGTRKFPVDYQWRPTWAMWDTTWGSFWPYSAISKQPRVRVTTKWGWDVTPEPVLQACLILSVRYFQAKDRAAQAIDGDPMMTAKNLLVDYAVEGGTLCPQPTVG